MTVAQQMSESVLLAHILKFARLTGWMSAHFRPGLTQRGKWITAVQGDGKGFPDLVLVHKQKQRCIVAELKVEKGKLTQEQKDWLDYFRAVPGIETYLWRPSDYDKVLGVLER